MKPALTPEEWASGHPHYDGVCPTLKDEGLELDGVVVRGQERHAVAALALYGQPFGFDWADVDLLELADAPDDRRIAVERLRDRIAALLPPRESA